MTTSALLGLVAAEDRPEFWIPRTFRGQILKDSPNGDATLFALSTLMKSEASGTSKVEWAEKDMPELQGAITDIFTDVLLTIAYVDSAVAGDVLYIQCAQAVASDYVPGKMANLQDVTFLQNTHQGLVIDVQLAGADSYVAVQLIEDDDNGLAYPPGGDRHIANATVIRVSGNSYSEGGEYLQAISYDPEGFFNYLQNFSNQFEITGEMLNSDVRLDSNEYVDKKRESLDLHGRDIEETWLFGQRAQLTGANGKRQRLSMGLIPLMIGSATAMVTDYRYEAAVNGVNIAGDAWTTSGALWLDYFFQETSLYGPQERTALCGHVVPTAIQQLAEANSDIHILPGANEWGLKVKTWMRPDITIHFKTHALMSIKSGWETAAIILPLEDLRYRYFRNRDTVFLPDPNRDRAGSIGRDGIIEGYRTQCGLEYHHQRRMLLMSGFGLTNLM